MLCGFDGCGPSLAACCGAGAQRVEEGSPPPFVAVGGDLDFGTPSRPQFTRAVEPVKPPEVPSTKSEGEVDEWLGSGLSDRATNEAVARAVLLDVYRKLAGRVELRSASRIVRECSTFSNPLLRRGMPLSVALANCGGIFASSAGSAKTFELSKPVGRLDYFLSHNWTTGRFPKFLALAYHFNSPLAVAAAAVGSALACALEVSGAMRRDNAWACTLLPYLVVLFGTRSTRRFAFLDKACIHQCDKVLQRQGIEQLSAFLCISREMVVVYTDSYLSRLWTVYELASMIILQPSARITVIPVSLVTRLNQFILFGFMPAKLILSVAIAIFQVPIEGNLLAEMFNVFVIGLMLLLGTASLRCWAREQSAIQAKVRQFKIREAICAVESDRQVVYGNVSAMMRVSGLVPAGSSEGRCLDAFDRMVAEVVPTHLSASTGRFGVGWRFTATLAVLLMEPGAGTNAGMSTTAAEATFVFVATAAGVLAWAPISMDCVIFLTRKRLDLRGPKEWAWVVALDLLAGALWTCFGRLHKGLLVHAVPHPDLGWLAIIALPCVALACVIAFYRPCHRHGRLSKGGAVG